MSAMIGPVHHRMYKKIILQDQLTDRLLELAEKKGWTEDLLITLEAKYGKLDNRPLEDIIDHSNIHGWLSKQVLRAEERFAETVDSLLHNDRIERLNCMKELFKTEGLIHSVTPKIDVETAYRVLDDLLLDGMPCDGGRQVISSDSDELIWQYDSALHSLCGCAEGQQTYNSLREAFLEGVLTNSGLCLEALGDTVYRLRREA